MESARRGLQVIRLAMLISITLYVVIAVLIPSHGNPNPLIFRIVSLVAVTNVGVLFVARRLFVASAADTLKSSPDNSAALAKWKTGHLITWAFAESIAIFGLVLHFLGFPMSLARVFFVAGFLLIAIFPPSRPN